MKIRHTDLYKVTRLLIGLSLLSVMFPTIGKQVQSPADRTAARQLFKNSDNPQNVSQSYAHLKQPDVRKKMQQLEYLDRHKSLINSALSKEVEMNRQGYMVFYVAIPYLRVLQDVARKLYKRVVGNVGALRQKSFQFFRYTLNDPTYMKYKNVTEFLLDEISREGIVDDREVRLRTILVSTNIAFFGNIGLMGEFTYNYFNHPQEWVSTNPEWLRASIKSFGYPPEFTEELMNIVPTVITDTGDLFQLLELILWQVPSDNHFFHREEHEVYF